MIIECPNCNKKFTLNENLIPANGRILKCSGCEHVWHYKIVLTTDLENIKLPEDQNIKLDINISEIDKNGKDTNEIIDDLKNSASSNVQSKQIEDSNDYNINSDKIKDSKKLNIKMVFVYFIIFIISLFGILLLLDTFKMYLSNTFPVIVPLFSGFYEILLDIKLFFKDLAR